MVSETVSDWRHGIRFRIDGHQWHWDGVGDHGRLHATAFQSATGGKRYWKVEVLEEPMDGSVGDAYTYGESAPLTYKMAKEIAERFVTGKKIPKRLEWR